MAKRSFARAGVKARPITFFIVSGIILLALLLTWTGLTLPVPGSDDIIEIKGARDIRFGIDIVGGVEAVFAPKDYEGNPSAEDLASARSVLDVIHMITLRVSVIYNAAITRLSRALLC